MFYLKHVMFIVVLMIIFNRLNIYTYASELKNISNPKYIEILNKKLEKHKSQALQDISKDIRKSMTQNKLHKYLILNNQQYRDAYYKHYISKYLFLYNNNKNIDYELFEDEKHIYKHVKINSAELQNVQNFYNHFMKWLVNSLSQNKTFCSTIPQSEPCNSTGYKKIVNDVLRLSPHLKNLHNNVSIIKHLTKNLSKYPVNYKIIATKYREDILFNKIYDSYKKQKNKFEQKLVNKYPQASMLGELLCGKMEPGLLKEYELLIEKKSDLDTYLISKNEELRKSYNKYKKQIYRNRKQSKIRFDIFRKTVDKYSSREDFQETYKKFLSIQNTIDQKIIEETHETCNPFSIKLLRVS